MVHCSVSSAVVREDSSAEAPGNITSARLGSDRTRKPANETDFRAEVLRVEQLARGLEGGLRTYHEHLQTAMLKQGYGPYHPLFRTHINGFVQDQIDLEDADEYRRGSFAFSLKASGKPLDPDPFGDWVTVQNWLDSFEATMDNARTVMAQADLFAANSTENIPREIFRQLRKRWRAASEQATEAYDHAMAIRAVLSIDGDTVPVPQSYRFISGGGRYATICAFGVCSSSTTADESKDVPTRH